MKWPSEYAKQRFRTLFPQYPHACPHAALDILVDALADYRRQDAQLRAMLDTAIPNWQQQVMAGRPGDDRFTFGT